MFFRRKKLPDFLIIGAQKAGTTSLYNYLTQHPQVEQAIEKELHYFDLNYDKSFEWYLKSFPELGKSRKNITGEASPYYIFHPSCAKRIKEKLPKVKLIIILRNPVDRAYSHYHHAVRNLGETLPFEEAIEREEARLAGELEKMETDPLYCSYNYQHYSYLSRGIYVDQLKKWYSLFPNKQILLLKYEDLLSNPSDYMKKVSNFLKISSHDYTFDIFNQGAYSKISEETKKQLEQFFKPHNEELHKFVQHDLKLTAFSIADWMNK
ncbi:hypothetical protein ABIE27_001553 [Paenibacillus sp. 4624]|uniref:sulfotransferase domain-containing protein n=1 Tax=Paenibacillus sp. 4624 TaxID=3156453 RepID=UPI003D1FE13F